MNAWSQSSSLIADGAHDFIRRAQLCGAIHENNSLMVTDFSANLNWLDSLMRNGTVSKKRKNIQVIPLPFSTTLQYNSHHPYGWNDGAMIPANGFQTIYSGGFKALLGKKISLQIQPEWVVAENTEFETFPTQHNPVYWENYYLWLNHSDIPEQFGEKPYRQLFAGQSSLRYQAGNISVGVSTENLWWGPGRFNALVMSNNAPGFAHLTLNTSRPISTKWGSIEGQLIAGKLQSSGLIPPDHNRYDVNGNLLYQPKPTQDRLLTGMILSWQPKWIPGMFLGFTSVAYKYLSAPDLYKKSAHIGSIFSRYVMPAEKAELYVEYGRNDKTPNPLNLLVENGYPRGYVAGFRKLFSSRRKNMIELAAEFTQLQLPTAELISQAASWYTSKLVPHGYTHHGQVLGAGIGPGSNSQLLDISYVKGFKKIGVKLERIVRNNDFFYKSFVITKDFTRHWVDISTTVHADLRYKKLLLSSQFAMVRSMNYQWYILEGLGYFGNGYDFLNFHARLSLAYLF